VERAVLLAPTTPSLSRTDDDPEGVDPSVAAASAEALKRDVAKWCEDNAPPFFGDRSVSVYEGAGHGLYAADHQRLNADILAFILAGHHGRPAPPTLSGSADPPPFSSNVVSVRR
jgi:hypothetical protein